MLYAPDFVDALPVRTVVFTMSSMARQMIHHSRRWGPDVDDFGAHAEAFFRSLALTCVELSTTPSDVWRPNAVEPRAARAIRWAEAHLHEDAALSGAARAAGASERTLSRLLVSETGLTWAQTLRRLRMIHAVERLTRPDNGGDRVTRIALASGYASLSAFERAFRNFTGLTPTAFRARHDGTTPLPPPTEETRTP